MKTQELAALSLGHAHKKDAQLLAFALSTQPPKPQQLASGDFYIIAVDIRTTMEKKNNNPNVVLIHR